MTSSSKNRAPLLLLFWTQTRGKRKQTKIKIKHYMFSKSCFPGLIRERIILIAKERKGNCDEIEDRRRMRKGKTRTEKKTWKRRWEITIGLKGGRGVDWSGETEAWGETGMHWTATPKKEKMRKKKQLAAVLVRVIAVGGHLSTAMAESLAADSDYSLSLILVSFEFKFLHFAHWTRRNQSRPAPNWDSKYKKKKGQITIWKIKKNTQVFFFSLKNTSIFLKFQKIYPLIFWIKKLA